MTPLTFLDYEVFETLRAQLAASSEELASRFSESILGYGFRPGDDTDHPTAFVLLCNPHETDDLASRIQKTLPDGALTFNQLTLPVIVSGSAEQQGLQHAITVQAGPVTPPYQTDISELVQVSLGQTIRQVVIMDHRKIILPSYLLRYTPFTSPNLIILRAALSQIHFLHQSGAGATDEFEQRSVSARMSEITRWSSFSRTSIYRLLNEDPRSRWLVDVENRGSYQNDQGQQIALPNQYTLQPLQLTPGDATDLATYLQTHQSDWDNLEDCLIALAKLDPRQVLAYPYRTPKQNDWKSPASVHDVLQGHFGSFELNAERLALLDKVRDNLIGDDFIAIPWYVLRSLLPIYGAAIITLYMMCQPLLYRNGSVQRDTFWLPGDNLLLTDWTGDRSLGKYFPKVNTKGRGRPATPEGSSDQDWRKNKRELLANFFLRLDTRRSEAGETQWQIQVHDFPILPEDANLIAQLYAILADLIRENRLEAVLSLFETAPFTGPQSAKASILDLIYRSPQSEEKMQVLSTIVTRLISDCETSVEPTISDFETPDNRLIALFETPVQEIISESATPVRRLFSEIETYLKILYRIKDSLKQFINSNLPPDSNLKNRSEDWNLVHLLKDFQTEHVQKINSTPETMHLFKAWTIWGALNARVHQPLNFAISQTIQEKNPPEAAALRLAELPLSGLRGLLEQMLIQPGQVNYHHDPDVRAQIADIQMLLLVQKESDRELVLQRLLDICKGVDKRGE